MLYVNESVLIKKKILNFCKIAKVHPDHVTAIISYGIQKDGMLTETFEVLILIIIMAHKIDVEVCFHYIII